MQNYIQVVLEVKQQQAEILPALLAEIGYEGFVEEEKSLQAFIPEKDFNQEALQKTLQGFSPKPAYHIFTIAPQNWNRQWEESFKPVEITPDLLVRAPFHQPQTGQKKVHKHQLIIQPKMSFGTGHHATTSGMMQLMLDIDWNGKHVLDFGTGTGILAILAQKLGAANVLAIDIDANAAENVQENLELNNAHNISFAQTDIHNTPPEKYDAILGNINKNIIIHSFPAIAQRLKQNGLFLASGFYCKDLDDIVLAANKVQLNLARQNPVNNWVSCLFTFA